MDEQPHICHHPAWIVYDECGRSVAGGKPGPAEMVSCECGQNVHCPVCGFGWDIQSCECHRALNTFWADIFEPRNDSTSSVYEGQLIWAGGI